MQQIIEGLSGLSKAIEGCRKMMLVCDSSYPFLNIKDEIECVLRQPVVFNQFSSNPLYEDVCKGVELFHAKGCDTILAIGGGSAIDVAKCIKLYCKMNKDELYLNQEYKDTGVKLIAIPTTAGTGSESTRYAVIYYDGKKQSVTHESIIPNVAILEPKVLMTLPIYQKKCTMMDALCQGIESWWSVNSTEESKVLSKKAIQLIIENWRDYIFHNNENAASKIMTAANLAGQAICITQTTAAHAFSYKITSMYHLPHGHAVAICLPHIWKHMSQEDSVCIDSRGREYLNSVFKDISLTMGHYSVEEAIIFWNDMLTELNISSPISEDKEKDLDILSHSVNPIRLKNNPVALDEDTIIKLYRQIVN